MVAFGSRVLSETTLRDVCATREQGHIAFLLSHGFMARMVLEWGCQAARRARYPCHGHQSQCR